MAKKANQHYVPKFYFRLFSQDGKSIHVLNRKNGNAIKGASIKGQASKKYFYGDAAAEDVLSEIDSEISIVMHKINNDLSFSNLMPGYYDVFLQNIMLQKTRTVTSRNKSKNMNEKLTKMFLEVEINNDETLTEEKRKKLLKTVDYIETIPQPFQGLEMSVAIESAHHLLDLKPVILCNKTNRPFIFGDAPIIFSNPFLKNVVHRGVLGAATPGLLVFYPLGNKHCIMLIDEKKYYIKSTKNSTITLKSLKDVSIINRLQIHNATSAVYFSDYKYSGYVTDLWAIEKDRLVQHNGKVVEALGVDENNIYAGEIMHAFEEQLPLIPKLSFLSYTQLKEYDYSFSRRDNY